MRPNRARILRRLHWTVLALVIAACSGGGLGGGCSACGGCLGAIPGGFDMTKASDNAVQVRVTTDGFNYLSQNFTQIASTLFPSGLTFTIPNITGSAGGFDYNICGIAASGNPVANGCGDGECKAGASIQSMTITPVAPSTVSISATVTIVTGDIDINTDNNPIECLFLSDMHCGVTYCPGSPSTLTADVVFTLDTTFWQLLSFNVTNIGGLTVDASSVNLYGKNTCGDIYCSGLGSVLLPIILPLFNLNTQLQTAIQNAVNGFRCMSCTTNSDCFTGAWNTSPATQNSCKSGKCVDSAGNCLPLLLGLQGELNLSQGLGSSTGLLGGFKNPAAKPVDIVAAAGGNVAADTNGLTLGVLGGAEATSYAACVGDLPPPTISPPPNINFDQLATTLLPSGSYTGYHVGLGVSQNYIENLIYGIHRGGGLCISLDNNTSSFLSTGTFKALLPSLGLVSGDATHDAPMMVVLTPTTVPQVTIGDGSYDNTQTPAVPVSPLLTVSMKNTNLDFYVLIEDRMVRVFTLTIDLNLPLSLIVEGGCTGGTASAETLTIALGDLKSAFTNVRSSNASIIAEDPATLAQLIPTFIGLAEPALAGALKPIALPAVSGFLVKLMEPACTTPPCESGLRGIVPGTASGQFQAMGGFAQMRLAGGACSQRFPQTSAHLVQTNIPPVSELIAQPNRALPWPSVTFDVNASWNGPVEYDWRIDHGFWTTWHKGPRLTIAHPSFLAQGWHTIEIRARGAGDSDTIEPHPVQTQVLFDWEPPEITLTQNAAKGTVDVTAWDLVTPASQIQFAYQLGDAPPSGYSLASSVPLTDVASAGGKLTVYAKDGAGNIGNQVFRMAVATPPNATNKPPAVAATQTDSGGGCSTAAGLTPAFGLISALALRLRRRRELPRVN